MTTGSRDPDRPPSADQKGAEEIREAEALAKHEDELLDEALEDTFPASDAVSIVQH